MTDISRDSDAKTIYGLHNLATKEDMDTNTSSSSSFSLKKKKKKPFLPPTIAQEYKHDKKRLLNLYIFRILGENVCNVGITSSNNMLEALNKFSLVPESSYVCGVIVVPDHFLTAKHITTRKVTQLVLNKLVEHGYTMMKHTHPSKEETFDTFFASMYMIDANLMKSIADGLCANVFFMPSKGQQCFIDENKSGYWFQSPRYCSHLKDHILFLHQPKFLAQPIVRVQQEPAAFQMGCKRQSTAKTNAKGTKKIKSEVVEIKQEINPSKNICLYDEEQSRLTSTVTQHIGKFMCEQWLKTELKNDKNPHDIQGYTVNDTCETEDVEIEKEAAEERKEEKEKQEGEQEEDQEEDDEEEYEEVEEEEEEEGELLDDDTETEVDDDEDQ